MSPLAPTSTMPPLAGLGINASVVRPTGDKAKQYGYDTWFVWNDHAAWIEHEGLTIRLRPEDVLEAANSMAGFVATEVHRRLHALIGLLEAFSRDSRWAAAFDTAVWGDVA